MSLMPDIEKAIKRSERKPKKKFVNFKNNKKPLLLIDPGSVSQKLRKMFSEKKAVNIDKTIKQLQTSRNYFQTIVKSLRGNGHKITYLGDGMYKEE